MRSTVAVFACALSIGACGTRSSPPTVPAPSAPDAATTTPGADALAADPSDSLARCVPTVAVSSQYRSASKHRPPAAEAPTKITVGEMLRMPALPEGDRATHTPPTDTEKTARVLDAFVFLAKIEGNDCDIHLEVGDRDGGDHVIVEVPSGAGYNGARRAVLEKLGVSALSTHPHKPKTPVPMRFTGYAFYDGTHYSRADPQRGNHHGGAEVGTLWELHPVWGVE